MTEQVVVVTGASSGFGALTARALAKSGHKVFAGMRSISERNVAAAAAAREFSVVNGVYLKALELDVVSDASVEAAVRTVMDTEGRIDVLVHNAGHMSFGPAEAFASKHFAELFDVNVLSTQRLNQAFLPFMRQQKKGLIVWVSSTSTRGGTPPFLAPYFAAKAAMDSLAVSYASELSQWGIETSIVVPGAFTKGTNHFKHAGSPENAEITAAYFQGPYAGIPDKALAGLSALESPDADANDVGLKIAEIVDMPHGKRPFRVHIDPCDDGAEVVNMVADRVRVEMFRRIGLDDLLQVKGIND